MHKIEYTHQFSTLDAEKYGVVPAIILANLRFWLTKNAANNENIYDGYVWTYNSIAAWQTLFPYLSAKQISHALLKLEKKGVIKTGNYNKAKFDKTKWYTISLKNSFCQKGLIDLPNMEDRSATNGNAIPDINTDSKPKLEQPAVDSVDFVEYVKKMKADKNKHIQIIGYYLEQKAQDVDLSHMNTASAFGAIIKRHAREAKELAAFDVEAIKTATQKARKESEYGKKYDWKLSTVLSKIA